MKFLDYEFNANDLITEDLVQNWETVFKENEGTVTLIPDTNDKLFYIRDKALNENWTIAWVITGDGNLYQFGPVTKPFILNQDAKTFNERFGIKIEKIDKVVDDVNNGTEPEKPVVDEAPTKEEEPAKVDEVPADEKPEEPKVDEKVDEAPVEEAPKDEEPKKEDTPSESPEDEKEEKPKEEEKEEPKVIEDSKPFPESDFYTFEGVDYVINSVEKTEGGKVRVSYKDMQTGEIKLIVEYVGGDNPTDWNRGTKEIVNDKPAEALPEVPSDEIIKKDEDGNSAYVNPEPVKTDPNSFPKLHGVQIFKAFGQELDDSDKGKVARKSVEYLIAELEDEDFDEVLNGEIRVYSLISSAAKRLSEEEGEMTVFLTILSNYFVSPNKNFIEFGDRVEIEGEVGLKKLARLAEEATAKFLNSLKFVDMA